MPATRINFFITKKQKRATVSFASSLQHTISPYPELRAILYVWEIPLCRITISIEDCTNVHLRHRCHHVTRRQTSFGQAEELPHALCHCGHVHVCVRHSKLSRFGVEIHQGNTVHTSLVLDLADSDSEERRLHADIVFRKTRAQDSESNLHKNMREVIIKSYERALPGEDHVLGGANSPKLEPVSTDKNWCGSVAIVNLALMSATVLQIPPRMFDGALREHVL